MEENTTIYHRTVIIVLLQTQLKIEWMSQYLSPYDINNSPANTFPRSNIACDIWFLTNLNLDLNRLKPITLKDEIVFKPVAFISRANTQLTEEY